MSSNYFLAPALVQLRDEVNSRFVRRDKTSDGWIGDASHAARASDHNPCWSCSGKYHGIVRAIDIDIDDNDPDRDLRKKLLNSCVGDPRVWYVISNGIIYSATYGWSARKYTGSNGHFAHVHVSLRHNVGEFNTDKWFDERPKIQPIPVSLEKVRHEFQAARRGQKVEFNNGVGRIQRQLKKQTGADLKVDGLVGKETLRAWGEFERKVGGLGRERIPDRKSLPALAQGRFRVVD